VNVLRFRIFSILLLTLSFISFSDTTSAANLNTKRAIASGTEGFDHSHLAWTNILQKYVTSKVVSSTVNYKALKTDPFEFNAYIASLEAITSEEYSQFSEKEKLAFLINAYNAFTVKLILDNYPLKSIKDLGTVLTSPWKIKFFTFLGERRYLDNIEHDMIRKNFNEPRIHFAVVCASIGCPALRSEAYTASTIDQQLEESAQNFLSDKARNRYNKDSKTLEISSIFKWYGGDFIKKFTSVEAFIASRITSDVDQQIIIREKKVSINYLDYDWSLNETK
jgi:hypothetical protein